MQVFGAFGAFGLIILFLLIGPLIVWGFWDNTMTPIFGVSDITFWEAVMLVLMSGVLFKSNYTVNESN